MDNHIEISNDPNYIQKELETIEQSMSFTELIKDANKYYAVIAVIATIFILVVLYLVWLDVKIRRIEKDNED